MSLKIVNVKYNQSLYNWPEDKMVSGSFELNGEGNNYSIHTIHITHGIEIKLGNQLIDSLSSEIVLDAYNNNNTSSFYTYDFSFPIHIPNKQEDNYSIINFFKIDIDIKLNMFDSKEIFYPNIVSSLLFENNDFSETNNVLEQLCNNQNIIETYKNDKFLQIPYFIHTTAQNIGITGLIKKINGKINAFELGITYFFIILIIPIIIIQIFPFLNVYKIGSFFIMFWMLILPVLFFIFGLKINTLINSIFLIDFQEIDNIKNSISTGTLNKDNIFNNIKVNYGGYNCRFYVYVNYVLNIMHGSSKTKTSKSFILGSIKIGEYSGNDLSIENITNIHENDWSKYGLNNIKTPQISTYYEIDYQFMSDEIFKVRNTLSLK